MPNDIHTAIKQYDEAGFPINLSGLVQRAVLDRFRQIEQARVLLNENPIRDDMWINRVEGRLIDD